LFVEVFGGFGVLLFFASHIPVYYNAYGYARTYHLILVTVIDVSHIIGY